MRLIDVKSLGKRSIVGFVDHVYPPSARCWRRDYYVSYVAHLLPVCDMNKKEGLIVGVRREGRVPTAPGYLPGGGVSCGQGQT